MIDEAKAALAAIEKNHPEEAEVLKNIVNQNLIALGTDEVFALRDDTGDIRAFKQNVRLSAANGTLVQPVYKGPYVVSAQGFEVLAEATGTCVIFPKEVLVGNEWRMNPYAERDPENRRILAVHARAVAFRFSSKGIPQVSDWTTIFDTPSYRLIDLLAKAKKFPQAFKLLPARMNEPENEGTWADYPFDESTTLWVNTAHEEALKWFSQILNREKKSMDFAQTFAKRNSVKHLLGIQSVPGQNEGKPINTWDVPVLCWRPTNGSIIKWDATQYAQLQGKVGNMIQGGGNEFAPNAQIESKAGKERVSDEAGFETLEAETDPEDQEPIDITSETVSEKTVDQKTGPSLSEEDQKIMDNFKVTETNFPDEVADAMKTLTLQTVTTPAHATAIMKAINEMFDMGGVS